MCWLFSSGLQSTRSVFFSHTRYTVRSSYPTLSGHSFREVCKLPSSSLSIFFPFSWYKLSDPYILVCALPSVCRLLFKTYGYSEVAGEREWRQSFFARSSFFKVKFCLYVDALSKKKSLLINVKNSDDHI